MSEKKSSVPLLLMQLKALKIETPELEYRFHPIRRWRFDLCWKELFFAVEVDGGVYVQGRHTQGKGYEKDCEKLGEAMALGWDVYRCTPNLIKSGLAIDTIERIINLKKRKG